MRHRLGLVAALLLASACSQDRYHWVEVPYCRSAPGAGSGHFEAHLHVLTKLGDGGGVRSLHGMRPLGDVLFDEPVLVAVVACDRAASPPRNLAEMLEAFDETTVPTICSGQRTVAGPVRVRASPTSVPGYAGSLRFPHVDDAELTCSGGTVARGADPARL